MLLYDSSSVGYLILVLLRSNGIIIILVLIILYDLCHCKLYIGCHAWSVVVLSIAAIVRHTDSSGVSLSEVFANICRPTVVVALLPYGPGRLRDLGRVCTSTA